MSVTFGIVAIDDVLKGTPQMKHDGEIAVARLGWTGMSASDLPKHQVVLFLKNYAQMRTDEGVEPSGDPDDRYYYVRPNGYQCVLRDIDGRVTAVEPREDWEQVFADGFPFDLNGADFEESIDQVRSLSD